MTDRRFHYWVLDGHTPRRATLLEYAEFMFSAERHVRLTELHKPGAEMVRISTVFLGIDHSFRDDGPPILFETMVFGGPRNEEQVRYATWDEAVAGHQVIVEELSGNGQGVPVDVTVPVETIVKNLDAELDAIVERLVPKRQK